MGKEDRLGFFLEKQNDPQSSWPVRDVLLREFINELYEGHLAPHQIDLLTQKKLYGKKFSRKDKFFRFFKGFELRKFSVGRLMDNQEFLLERLNKTEAEVVEVSLGLREVGIPLNKNEASEKLNSVLGGKPVDLYLASAHEKLFSQKNKQ